MAIPGIIHQHVNSVYLPFGVRHSCRNGVEVGHVEHQRMSAVGCECGKGFGVGSPAHCANHPMAGVQRAFGECSTQAGADAGDEEGLRNVGRHS